MSEFFFSLSKNIRKINLNNITILVLSDNFKNILIDKLLNNPIN